MGGLRSKKSPTEAGKASIVYLASTPRQDRTPAYHQCRAELPERARNVQTAAQVQKQIKGVSTVMSRPPMRNIGTAGNSKTAIRPPRAPPQTCWPSRNTPQAVTLPRSTAGSRMAGICVPVNATLRPPVNSVAIRISHAMSGRPQK